MPPPLPGLWSASRVAPFRSEPTQGVELHEVAEACDPISPTTATIVSAPSNDFAILLQEHDANRGARAARRAFLDSLVYPASSNRWLESSLRLISFGDIIAA